MSNESGRIVNGYFYTFLIVARDETYLSAGRLTSIPSFAATVVAIIAAIATRYIRRLKPVLIMGFAIQTLAYGLMIRFRQSSNSQAEVIIVQILKGFGIGMISFPAQAVIQSATAHEHLAAVTATYLIIFYLTVSHQWSGGATARTRLMDPGWYRYSYWWSYLDQHCARQN